MNASKVSSHLVFMQRGELTDAWNHQSALQLINQGYVDLRRRSSMTQDPNTCIEQESFTEDKIPQSRKEDDEEGLATNKDSSDESEDDSMETRELI